MKGQRVARNWTNAQMNAFVRNGTIPGKPSATTTSTRATTSDTTRRPRRGAPRDLSGLSAGNPFADDTRQRTGYDDTFSGYTDMRRHVAPTYEMSVPHRVTAWPDSTPSVSARAASYGR